jgi:putative DNA primase/helicase
MNNSGTYTDVTNAERFVNDQREILCYCRSNGQWLVWAGDRWRWDDADIVLGLGQDTVRSMLVEAMAMKDDYRRKEYENHAVKSEGRARIDAMLYLSRPHLAVRPEDLDSDPALFNCANGTLNLTTYELKPHDSSHLITKISPVEYQANAQCGHWLDFLRDITKGDQGLIDFLQRTVGYSMTGDTREHCLFMLYGSGCNGKSTFVESVRHVLGDYARTADFGTFMQQKASSAPRNDLAMLRGARFVTATESDDGKHLAEAFIKTCTGGDTVTARFLYGEHFEFAPQFKLWLSTNHKPKVHGVDDGIWRRIKLIPFSVRIPDDKIDRQLPEKLKAEAQGILSWAVEGLKQYRLQGLDDPSLVRNATVEYREDEDVLGRFLTGSCAFGDSLQIQGRRLYTSFKEWAASYGESVIDEKKFAKCLADRGLRKTKTKVGNFWIGIGLNDPSTS